MLSLAGVSKSKINSNDQSSQEHLPLLTPELNSHEGSPEPETLASFAFDASAKERRAMGEPSGVGAKKRRCSLCLPVTVVVLLLFVAAGGFLYLSTPEQLCSRFALAGSEIDGIPVVVTGTSYYPAGRLVNVTSGLGTLETSTDVQSFCRISFTLTTNSKTNNTVDAEAWLPNNWNARMVGIGNGGWTGGIPYSGLAYEGVNKQYAAFGSNTGHDSEWEDASWALNNPEAIIDFGWRALHYTTVVSKGIITRYYRKPIWRSYYMGCSSGGRQGLKAIQMFPEDFDGALVGAPANRMAGLLGWGIRQNLLMNPPLKPESIPPLSWLRVHKEVLNQCDHLDGVVDELVGDPELCKKVFKPNALICQGKETPESSLCLTKAQLNTWKKLYTDYVEKDGTWIFSGFDMGGELIHPLGGLLFPEPFPIATSFYKHMVFNDTKWDYNNLDATSIKLGLDLNLGNMDVISPDLGAFAARGGKVIHYTGLSDPLISAGNRMRWFNEVDKFTKNAFFNTSASEFYRLFPIPGMAHCVVGDGANGFGGVNQRGAGTPPLDEFNIENDIFASLVYWVENFVPPDYIVGTNWPDNDHTQGAPVFTRKHCPYPEISYYKGGDPNKAESFECGQRKQLGRRGH
ncbi:tannase-domain-containing protein [Meredithblackwellia eburnea MCA 4105]